MNEDKGDNVLDFSKAIVLIGNNDMIIMKILMTNNAGFIAVVQD